MNNNTTYINKQRIANNHDALAKWANATTGFPWIDAIMTQLREEVEMIFYNRSH